MNEKVIWDFLFAKTGNAYGTAAIMGNLMAESSLNPLCATGKNKTANYAKDADNGDVDFVHDGVAFGLVQWCFYARKGGFYAYAKEKGKSVGDLQTQLEYLVKEMSQSYKSVWSAVVNAKNIRSASDPIMLKYENPATTTETAKQKRANYGKKFYDQFVVKPQQKPDPEPTGKKIVRAEMQVNIRSGRGKDKDRLGELNKGQSVEYLATENGWHKVAVWVMGDFVEVVQQ